MNNIKIVFVRHGATKGNMEHRYVGTTDEALLPESRDNLAAMRDVWRKETGDAVRLFVSPLLRARQSAEVLFPGVKQNVIAEFAECNFGAFEYKNYAELNGNPDYQRYIDSCGETAFPDGESKPDFIERTMRGFCKMLSIYEEEGREDDRKDSPTIVVVAHGGTLMAIMDRLSNPHRDYFAWQMKPGCGIVGCLQIQDGNSKFLIMENP